ncbi:MAG: ABC transporter permease [Eubacterium sp.]|nr:ABC transporter permease [Eubacterium sp.]
MQKNENSRHEPLFHIAKRSSVSMKKAIAVRAIAIVAALLVAGVFIFAITKRNPIEIYKQMFLGVFGSAHRITKALKSLAILLCISLAVTPAFKMKFWNCGAEGQALIGGLACAACMFYIGGSVPKWLLVIIMTVTSILAGAIWAVIPALFKAKWNTNETLFTLMMNYVATSLVAFFIKCWAKDGSGILRPMTEYGLPQLANTDYLLAVIVVTLLTVATYIYMKYSKHGYEIAVVGESENTARYIGINVKKVIIRTMLLSGAICGLCGLLLVGGIDKTISTETIGGQGFTAIMVSWLGKFNPIFMILTSFLIVFLQVGTKQVSTSFRIDTSLADITTAIILFFIIGCEFFINYKIMFRKKEKEVK